MTMNAELKAALLFGDREYSEMLKYELTFCGFDIAKNENEADIILTEEEFLPYISNDIIVIAFMKYGFENPERDGKTIVFPYVFQTSEFRKRLRELYLELVRLPAQSSASLYDEKIEIVALPDKKNALVGNETVALSSTEWKMLSLLTEAAKAGKGVSREAMGDTIGHKKEHGGNIVDVYICRLRKKIEIPHGRRLIFTVRGVGYSLMKG